MSHKEEEEEEEVMVGGVKSVILMLSLVNMDSHRTACLLKSS